VNVKTKATKQSLLKKCRVEDLLWARFTFQELQFNCKRKRE